MSLRRFVQTKGALSRAETFQWAADVAREIAAALEPYEFNDVTAAEQRAIAACREAFRRAEQAAQTVANPHSRTHDEPMNPAAITLTVEPVWLCDGCTYDAANARGRYVDERQAPRRPPATGPGEGA